MITLMQKAMRYAIGGKQEETLSSRPKLEDFVSTNNSGPETKEFEGKVTSMDSSCIVIDQDVYCDPSNLPSNSKVGVGVKVRGVADRKGKHEMWRAKTIDIVLEEWDSAAASTSGNRLSTTAISCKDLAEGIPGILKSDLLSSVSSKSPKSREIQECNEGRGRSKTVIGKVTGVYGDMVTLNNTVFFTVTNDNCSIDLVPGDWIVCDVDGKEGVGDGSGQVKDNGTVQVSSLKPLRKKRVRGEVTYSNEKRIIINEEIFCSRSIPGASLAKIGDTMTVEIIESQQESLCWRALSIASPDISPSTQEPGIPSVVQFGPLSKVDIGKNRIKDILEDKGHIMINKNIRFPQVILGSAAFTEVSIKNTGPSPTTLRRVYFVSASQESQFSVTSVGRKAGGTEITIEGGTEVVVRLCCSGMLIGLLKQLCVFEFEDFNIGRHVSAIVEDPIMASLAPVTSSTSRQHYNTSAMPYSNERWIISGQRMFKPSPFIPVKLPGARVPENLWHEVNQGDLFNIASVLREPLSVRNHKKKFTLLLHLEEIKMTQQMRQFDMERANFMRCGEFLSLTVPGLAEKRPSLMIGDSVIATDFCNAGETEYEGCIHQVLNQQVLLKFHPAFHNSYYGEDYKVRFNFNRTPLRRCHLALTHTMKQLGEDILFPFKLKLQLPQVCYIDPEVQELTKQWKKCPSTSYQFPPVTSGSDKPLPGSEREGHLSPPKLPVVTRLFGVHKQDSDASGCHKESNKHQLCYGSESGIGNHYNAAEKCLKDKCKVGDITKDMENENEKIDIGKTEIPQSQARKIVRNPSCSAKKCLENEVKAGNSTEMDNWNEKIEIGETEVPQSKARKIIWSPPYPAEKCLESEFKAGSNTKEIENWNENTGTPSFRTRKILKETDLENPSNAAEILDVELTKNVTKEIEVRNLNTKTPSFRTQKIILSERHLENPSTEVEKSLRVEVTKNMTKETEIRSSNANTLPFHLRKAIVNPTSAADRSLGAEVKPRRVTKMENWDENTETPIFQTLPSRKQDSHNSVHTHSSSYATESKAKQDLWFDNNNKEGHLNRNTQRKETKEVTQPKDPQKLSDNVNSTFINCSNGKAGTFGTKLIPRSLDLAMCRSANRRKIPSNEENMTVSGKPVKKDIVSCEDEKYQFADGTKYEGRNILEKERQKGNCVSNGVHENFRVRNGMNNKERKLENNEKLIKPVQPMGNGVDSGVYGNFQLRNGMENEERNLNKNEKPWERMESMGNGVSNGAYKHFQLMNETKNEGANEDNEKHMKEVISGVVHGNYWVQNGTTKITPDKHLCGKEKLHVIVEDCGKGEQGELKGQPSKIRRSNGTSLSPLKKKTSYVIPVLPLVNSRKSNKNIEKLPVLKWFNKSLNREQKLAVRRILEGTTRPLPYVIFGPPGTGKTVTLVEVALQIMTLMDHTRLLIVTPSNSASDLLAERLVKSGQLGTSDMVRLIAFQRVKESIPESIKEYCCHGEELEVRSHQRVIIGTATCAGVLYMQGLHKEHFTHVLVDEAGQLTEPECLVPLGLVNRVTGQIVLAGDPKQLGPVIQSDLAKRGGLQQSFLQRLCQSVLYQAQSGSECGDGWEYEPSLVTQLVRNYRSHPDILAVPSRLFYNNTLIPCADIKTQEYLLSWEELPCKSCPVLFHGVVGANFQEGDSPSWFNPAEAFQVVRYTKSLLIHGVEEENIGIITPYKKQVEKLHKLLTIFGIEGVKVGSVEEFQGQERMVILISTVRSSTNYMEEDAKYNLGFIKCCKRFNVAITRAQSLLVIIGNPLLLSVDQAWKEMIRFCIEKGAYRGPELDNI